jgi:hypothetical protein
MLQEEDPEMYQKHFASYIANDLDGDSLEDKYKEVGLKGRLVFNRSAATEQWP